MTKETRSNSKERVMSKSAILIVGLKIEVLETLLGELAEHKYTRPEHIESHIKTTLDIFNDIKTGYEYEIDARGKDNG